MTMNSHSTSAVRALDLFEYLLEQRRPMRASEIVRCFSWQTSSTAQLLKSLVCSSHLLFDDRTKLYQPAPRLLRRCEERTRQSFGFDKIFELLRLAFREIGGERIVAIAARNGGTMQVIASIEPDGSDADRHRA